MTDRQQSCDLMSLISLSALHVPYRTASCPQAPAAAGTLQSPRELLWEYRTARTGTATFLFLATNHMEEPIKLFLQSGLVLKVVYARMCIFRLGKLLCSRLILSGCCPASMGNIILLCTHIHSHIDNRTHSSAARSWNLFSWIFDAFRNLELVQGLKGFLLIQ